MRLPLVLTIRVADSNWGFIAVPGQALSWCKWFISHGGISCLLFFFCRAMYFWEIIYFSATHSTHCCPDLVKCLGRIIMTARRGRGGGGVFLLQHTATHCNQTSYDQLEHFATLHHSPTFSNTLQHTATHCNTLQRPVTHCNRTSYDQLEHVATLQHSSTHCNKLQHTATHCNTLQSDNLSPTRTLCHTKTHSNTLQHTPTLCNTLQHTATHCNQTSYQQLEYAKKTTQILTRFKGKGCHPVDPECTSSSSLFPPSVFSSIVSWRWQGLYSPP